jgi:hypothetical protein
MNPAPVLLAEPPLPRVVAATAVEIVVPVFNAAATLARFVLLRRWVFRAS